MAAFLTAIKRAGKGVGRMEKKRFQQKYGMKSTALPGGNPAAGSDPVADAVREDLRGKKRSNGKGRD